MRTIIKRIENNIGSWNSTSQLIWSFQVKFNGIFVEYGLYKSKERAEFFESKYHNDDLFKSYVHKMLKYEASIEVCIPMNL